MADTSVRVDGARTRPPETSRALLVVNPASGGGRALRAAPAVVAALQQDGWQVRAVRSRSLVDVEERIARLDEGDLVAVLGGDGTLGSAAAGAFRSSAVLAPLPGGRGNDLCRALGVSLDPVTAARGLATAERRRIDVGLAGTRVFVCVAHAGFDSVANDIANRTHLLRGTPVYVYAALRAVSGWQPAVFGVDTGNGPREHAGWSVAVANAPSYGGGMKIAPHAVLDDGRLAVTLIGDVSRPDFLRTLPTVFSGRHVEHPKVSTDSAPAVTLSADRPFDVYADGELVGPLPMTFRCLPSALEVAVSNG
jgi:YegS/Rv2252/BmrU family lipid kinase